VWFASRCSCAALIAGGRSVEVLLWCTRTIERQLRQDLAGATRGRANKVHTAVQRPSSYEASVLLSWPNRLWPIPPLWCWRVDQSDTSERVSECACLPKCTSVLPPWWLNRRSPVRRTSRSAGRMGGRRSPFKKQEQPRRGNERQMQRNKFCTIGSMLYRSVQRSKSCVTQPAAAIAAI
jgi:hypothetical protein